MFVLEKIDEKWRPVLEKENTSKYYKDPLNTMGYWYVDHDRQEAIFCTESVSESIVRCDPGESYYHFLFFVKDTQVGISVDFYSLSPHYRSQWNEKNRMSLGGSFPAKLTKEELMRDAKEAILFHINNSGRDYCSLEKQNGQNTEA